MTPVMLLAALVAAPTQDADPRRTPVVEAIERAKPAVVSITTNVRGQMDFLGQIFQVEQRGSSGTGVMIYPDGFLITNNHVIAGATEIEVRFDPDDDPQAYPAQLVSTIPTEDLALLKITRDEPFPIVSLCESEPILGEPVIAIGNALGHSHTVSQGIVSGLHRDVRTKNGLAFDNLIQTDASINQGNSGGPLLNISGELIGINSAMEVGAENIGFAIPVGRVRTVLAEQLLSPTRAQAWVGFEVDEETLAVVVVTPEGPAEAAGLERGDRLLELDGTALLGAKGEVLDVYRRLRQALLPATTVRLEVQRGRRREHLELVPWKQVDGVLFERLGLGLEPVLIGPYGGTSYLHVTAVQRAGPADVAGLQRGDVLRGVALPRQRAVHYRRPDQLANVVARLKPGTVIEVELWRDLNENGIYFERDIATDYSEGLRGPLTVR
jgi:serine protease Do